MQSIEVPLPPAKAVPGTRRGGGNDTLAAASRQSSLFVRHAHRCGPATDSGARTSIGFLFLFFFLPISTPGVHSHTHARTPLHTSAPSSPFGDERHVSHCQRFYFFLSKHTVPRSSLQSLAAVVRSSDRRSPRVRQQTQISKRYRRRPTETTANRRRHVVLARLRRQTFAGFQMCDQGCYCRSRRHRVGQIRRIRREYRRTGRRGNHFVPDHTCLLKVALRILGRSVFVIVCVFVYVLTDGHKIFTLFRSFYL